jgi:multiple sugar transport system permease protein
MVASPQAQPKGIRIGRFQLRLAQREAIEFYLFILPWVIGFLAFTLGPMIASLRLSFTDYSLLAAGKWIGSQNYVELSRDPLFWQSLKVTVTYAAMALPTQVVTALLMALLLNQPVHGISVFRVVFYLPAVISGVAVALLWVWIFNPTFGLLNSLLAQVGIKGPGWVFDVNWALPSLVIMSLWSVGGTMMIYLAALQGIPSQLYEAAEIDGASGWTKFARITLPMITPAIFFNLVTGIIGTFQIFTQAYVMTRGGPVNATLFYVLYLYRNAFEYLKMGLASAMAWILLLLVLVLTWLAFRTSRWVYYETEVR